MVEAAAIASASLAATLEAARRVPADRRILYFAGDPARTPHAGFEVIAQPRGALDERLRGDLRSARRADSADRDDRLLQLRAGDLRWPRVPTRSWDSPRTGFWALGMRRPRGDVIRGVPMSRPSPDTGALQLAALARAGLTVDLLDTLRDVDLAGDAQAVAAQIPGSARSRARCPRHPMPCG